VTINCQRESGKRFIAKKGPHKVYLDGVEIKCAWYTDGRRKVVRYYLKDENGHFLLAPDGRRPLSREVRGRKLQRIPA
jgi:hypothetical protein